MITVTYRKPAPEITVGTHAVTIVDAQPTTASTGTPQLHVTVQTQTGAIGHAYLPLTEKAEFNICQLIDAVGIAAKEGDKIQLDPVDLIDKTCWVTVVQRANGQKQVRRFHASQPANGNSRPAQADDDDNATT